MGARAAMFPQRKKLPRRCLRACRHWFRTLVPHSSAAVAEGRVLGGIVNGYEVIHEKSPAFYDLYERKGELQQQTHYCPGCGHGIVHKLIAEALTDLGLQDRTILVSPVGCSVFAYYYFDVGNVQVAHGRAPAAATALKRSHPESIVMAYQGDGDLAAIGTAEIVHAANRGENISVFFVNNSVYGMTGGQMAPTSLMGEVCTTSPFGRRASNEGLPLHVCELLAALETPTYIERVALNDMKNIMKAKRAVKKALEIQKNGGGFSLVEILSPCPTIMKMDPVVARKWVGEALVKAFPLGVFRDHKPELPAGPEIPVKTVAQALNLLRSPEDAQDVYQEAFLRVYRNLHTFRFDCSFHTWLYRIVTNICLDQLRKRKVRKEESAVVETTDGCIDRMDTFQEDAADSDPERSMWNLQLKQKIETALQDLTPRERVVFELRHYQGLRLRNIGEMLGTTEEAAKNCLFRSSPKKPFELGDFT